LGDFTIAGYSAGFAFGGLARGGSDRMYSAIAALSESGSFEV
jgi:hypothetical protein